MVITFRQQNDIISFCFFIIFSTALYIVPGFYFADVIVFMALSFLFFNRKVTLTPNEKQYMHSVILLVLLPNYFFIAYQVVTGVEFNLYSIYIIYNVTLSLFYILFVKEFLLDFCSRNLKFITILFMVPLFIALGMIFSPYVNQTAIVIYNIEETFFGRFGGIWGADVNQLGYYATVVMVWSVFLLSNDKIDKVFYSFVQFICIFVILMSGMRTGIVVYAFSLILVAFLSIKIRKVLLLNIIAIIAFSLLIVIISPFIADKFDLVSILERFSVDLFIGQLTGESGDAHLGNMYKKWYEIFSSNTAVGDLLFSMGGYWKFPDSLVIFYFANTGLIGVGLLLTFLMFSLFKLLKLRLYIGLFLFIFMFSFSFKGNFPLNNFSMFLFILVIYLNDYSVASAVKQKSKSYIL